MNRAALLATLALAGCASVLGLEDIQPDGDAFGITITGESSATVGQPLDRLNIQIVDVLGHRVADFNGQITLALGANASNAKLLGTATTTANAGFASFNFVGIDRAGTGYTLVASSDGLVSATSGPIDIIEPTFQRVSTGRDGSYMQSVTVAPTASGRGTAFASAADGVYTSTDGAATWRPAGFGADRPADTMIADFQQPGVVYMLSAYSSLRKTSDYGATWQDIATWSNAATDTTAIAFDRATSTLYAVASRTIRRSTDGGATWQEAGTNGCLRLVADQVTPRTLYCFKPEDEANPGANYAIYKSSDAGATWAITNTGLTKATSLNFVVATPTGVFASRDDGVYRLPPAGTTWSRVQISFGGALAYAPSNPMRVYLSQGSIAVSNDGGATFGTPVNMPDYIIGLAVDPANPDLVYAAGTAGMFVSSNGGASWARASNGIEALSVRSLALAPDDPNTLLLATPNAALRTTNGGASWTSPTGSQNNLSMFFDATTTMRAYQCGGNYFAVSTDRGASFSNQPSTGLLGCDRMLTHGGTYFAFGGGRFFKSTNLGSAWTETVIPNRFVYDGVFGDADGNVIVAITSQGIYRSTNAGASFQEITDSYVSGVASDPSTPSRIVAGTCQGFRVSTDAGATFGEAVQDKLCVQFLTRTGGAIYAAAQQGQKLVLARSTDGGATWATTPLAGVSIALRVTGLAATADGTVYVATGGGLFKGTFR